MSDPFAASEALAELHPPLYTSGLIDCENGNILREIGDRGALRSLWRQSTLVLVFHSNIGPNMPLF